MPADAIRVLEEARNALEAAGLRYMLVGASALNAYTLPRATFDLDILVESTVDPLDHVLRKSFPSSERTKDVFFDQTGYIFEVGTYVTPVEMFVATHWLTREALARPVVLQLPPLGALPVARPMDITLLKAWVAAHPARPASKRALDVDDLRRLRAAEPTLDDAAFRAIVARMGEGPRDILRQAGYAIP